MMMMNQRRSSQGIALKEWIHGAVDESIDALPIGANPFDIFDEGSSRNNPRTTALSSKAFLFPALKVARSLAEQVCHLPHYSLNASATTSPVSEWADNVTVRVSLPPSFSEGDVTLGSGGCHETVEQEPARRRSLTFDTDELQELTARPGDDDLLDALKLFSDDEEIAAHGDEKKVEERGGSGHWNQRNKLRYLDVEDANLDVKASTDMNDDIVAYCENYGGSDEREKSELWHIYSLGLVLYEIFSGGERPSQTQKVGIENKASINLSGALNILDDSSPDNQMIMQNTSIPTKKKKRKNQSQLASMEPVTSVEPLKSRLNLPTKLCDLIANMLDCSSGDLRGDETYSRIEDVCADLQSMIDKPDKFLMDIDIMQASRSGLPLNETTYFGRDEELMELKSAFQRSLLSGESELGVIAGPSGIGKSVLAQRFGSFASENGGIFLRGKFDQLKHQSSPFSALAAAFDGYCDIMMSQERKGLAAATGDHYYAQEVASRLKAVLGTELHHLERVIPKLSSLLNMFGCNTHEGHDSNQECIDAQQRVIHLLCQFVDVISTYSGAPIILFLDDLQFADESSINIMRQLLMMPASSNHSSSKSKQLFFLGCCREEGLSKDHSFGAMLSNVRGLGVHVTDIKLECMDKEAINKVISSMFCLPPRLTRPLADALFSKSKGNPLFFSQLISSLEKDKTLWLSLDRRRYVWDLDKILFRQLPANVAAFFADTIEKLDTEVQSALTLLSYFGARSQISLIQILESLLSLNLVAPLEVAVSEGLLNKIDGKFCFSHDRVQEAAYNKSPPEQRCIHHFEYGVALASYALETKNDELLFIAVSQVNHGGPAAAGKDAAKRLMCAQLNLKVGKVLAMSDFQSAYNFFDHGINFLQKGHWVEHYDLSLDLFESSAKCALVLGDTTSLNILSEQTLKYAKNLEDKLTVLFISTCALKYSNKLTECIDKATSVLALLGEELPDDCCTESNIKILAEQTRILLRGFSDQDLLEHKIMSDKRKIMAMRFYAILEGAMQYAKSDSQPIVTLKIVQLSIAYGMSPMSPVGFSYLGMLIARLGDIREGYRFVKLARMLLDRVGTERAGEVIYVGTQIRCFVEPIQATYHLHLEGYNAAMAAGDISSALTNMICHTVGSFEASINLQLVKENCEKARRLMEQYNHLIFLVALVAVQRSILGIIGGDIKSKWAQNESPYSSLLDYINNMFLDFTFRNYDQMKANTEKYFECNHVKSWSLLFSHSTHESISGLASFWIYRQSNDSIWLERGVKAKEKFKNWYDASSNTGFEPRLLLLQAEEHYAKKDIESAKVSYEEAISSARRNHFINIEAYAYELAGYFYLEQGDVSCFEYFANAQQKFYEWGAFKKAAALDGFIFKATEEVDNVH